MFDDQIPEEDEQESPRQGGARRFVPWLFALGIGLLFLPLYLFSNAIDDSTTPLATQAQELQATITSPPPVPPEEATLAQQLLDVRSQLSVIESVPATLAASHVDWPAIAAVVHDYNADQIRLTAFSNDAGRLTIGGGAMQENSVLDYAHGLDSTGYFSNINVQSITTNPTPPPTPNPDGTSSLEEPYFPFVFILYVDIRDNSNGS